MAKITKEQAEVILDVMTKQKFSNWHGENGRFESYLTGEFPKGHPEEVTKEMILKDIREMFSK